jgi:short-subunit dehydrogenase
MKKIFLTGASAGIGKAIALAAIEKGHEVWGTSRDVSRLPKLAGLHHVQLDLSNISSIDNAFAGAIAEAGNFDVLINNAGSGHFGPAQELSEKDIMNQFQLLVFGPVQLVRLALEAMQSRGEGLIINVSSLASRLPVPFMAAYNSAKAALAAFTMSIQLEVAASGIRIVDLQPADICTEFNDALQKAKPGPRYEAAVAKTWQAVDRNMKTAPQPDLIARHVLRLIDGTNPPPRLALGGTFQAKIAPLIFRFLPQRVRLWGLRNYYGI